MTSTSDGRPQYITQTAASQYLAVFELCEIPTIRRRQESQ
jgi:hypothetical protein